MSELEERPEPMLDRAEGCIKEECRPVQERLREYEIVIRFLSVGCVVKVGCKEIPFSSNQKALEAINEYVKDPYKSTKKWHSVFEGKTEY